MKISARHADSLNIVLILFTCILAHLFPFHLVLFSYAILGPAHYLTQISWMHDRRYFSNGVFLAPVMVFLSLILTGLQFYTGSYQAFFGASIFSLALGVSFLSVLPRQKTFPRFLTMAAVMLCCCYLLFNIQSILFLALVLPTLIHIFVFTAAFMLAGSLRSGKKAAYASVIALFVCAGSFFLPVSGDAFSPHLEGMDYFQPLVAYLQSKGLSATTDTQFFGFLSYAYTYHYLNWFSKAEIIHWNKISRKRMQAIAAIYIVTFAAYLYNFKLGFTLMLGLSFLHVMLEFPLDMRTLAGLFVFSRKAEKH